MSEKMTYQYDHATGIEEVRPATTEELDLLALGAEEKNKREELRKIELAKKESGRAKLIKLGLNQSEIDALIGAEPKEITR